MINTGYDWLDKALAGNREIHTPVGVAIITHVMFEGDKVAKIKVDANNTEYEIAYLDKWRRVGRLCVGQNVYYGHAIGTVTEINYGVDGLPEVLFLAMSPTMRAVRAADVSLQPVEGCRGAYQTQAKCNITTEIVTTSADAERLSKRLLDIIRKPAHRYHSGGYVRGDALRRPGEVEARITSAFRPEYITPKPLHERVLDDYENRLSKIGPVNHRIKAEMMRRALKRYYGDPENSFVREHYERNPDTGEVTFVRKGEAECPNWVLKEERSRRGVVIDGPKFTLEKAREICGAFGWYVTEKKSLRAVQEKFARVFASKLGKASFNDRVTRALYETIEEMTR